MWVSFEVVYAKLSPQDCVDYLQRDIRLLVGVPVFVDFDGLSFYNFLIAFREFVKLVSNDPLPEHVHEGDLFAADSDPEVDSKTFLLVCFLDLRENFVD